MLDFEISKVGDSIVRFLQGYGPSILNTCILGMGVLVSKIIFNRATTRSILKIHQATLLAEIKTKHLLEIYPKLNSEVHAAAGPLMIYFKTITDQVEKHKRKGKELDEAQIRQFFEDYWMAISSHDGFINTEGLEKFNNALAHAKLFISKEVDKIAEEIRTESMNLFKLAREEIENGTYKKYSKAQLLQLLDKAGLSILSLNQNKDRIAKRMNKDLTASL